MRSTVVSPSLITAGSMTGDLTSLVQNMNQIVVAAIQAVWTGTPTGTLKLQASNDNVVWTDLSGSQSLSGAAGNYIWHLADIGYQYLRVVYTHSSSTGVLNVTASIKGV